MYAFIMWNIDQFLIIEAIDKAEEKFKFLLISDYDLSEYVKWLKGAFLRGGKHNKQNKQIMVSVKRI